MTKNMGYNDAKEDKKHLSRKETRIGKMVSLKNNIITMTVVLKRFSLLPNLLL